MKIRIKDIEREVQTESNKLYSVSFNIDVCGDKLDFQMLQGGNLYIQNKKVHQSRVENGSTSGIPLELKASDLHYVEAVVKHWKEIAHNFVYLFHDTPGAGLLHVCDEQRPSLDNAFPSRGCIYTFKRPFEQHYNCGRLYYYLYSEAISIGDSRSIQNLLQSQAESVVELLDYASFNPSNVVDRLVGENRL